jgi:hypothetical protein
MSWQTGCLNQRLIADCSTWMPNEDIATSRSKHRPGPLMCPIFLPLCGEDS